MQQRGKDVPTARRFAAKQMRGIALRTVVGACLVGAGAGCGASLKSSIEVPAVHFAAGKNAGDRIPTSTFLYVDEFVDKRDSKVIATVDGKNVSMDGDAVAPVVSSLRDALSQRGFAFSDAAPVILSGELRTWKSDIAGSLPTKLSSEAAIFVEVLDPANKRIYSGVYRGYAHFEGGSINDDDLKKNLANAMEEAILQVARDPQLVSLLSSC